VTDYRGDGCAVIPPNSFSDTEQVLKARGLSRIREMSDLRTVNCNLPAPSAMRDSNEEKLVKVIFASHRSAAGLLHTGEHR
jgi:hypothetical protein